MASAFSKRPMASSVRLDMKAWVPSRCRASTFSFRRTRRFVRQLRMRWAVCCKPTTNVTMTAPIDIEIKTSVTGLRSNSTPELVRMVTSAWIEFTKVAVDEDASADKENGDQQFQHDLHRFSRPGFPDDDALGRCRRGWGSSSGISTVFASLHRRSNA